MAPKRSLSFPAAFRRGRTGQVFRGEARFSPGPLRTGPVWQQTFDAVPDLLAILDLDRRVVGMNEALRQRLGPDADACLGKPCHEVFHASGQPPAQCPYTRTLEDAQPHEDEVPVERLGRDYCVRTTPLRDAEGRLRGSVHLARDLSDRRARERGLLQLNRMVQALSRSSQAMSRAQDEASYMQEVCRIVVEDCGCAMVWIGFRQDDAARSIVAKAWAGLDQGYLETLNLTWDDQPRGRGPTGTAVRTGRPRLVHDMASEPDFAPWRTEALKRGFASSLALPLLEGGTAFGALTVYASEAHAFTEAHVRVLGELAEALALGIVTLRLRERERRAQEALQETTIRLRRLNDELEQRVQDRTADLVRANAELTAGILERDRALGALQASEEKLRHAQKMEAIGTLAGGVAHDFNNLLQVINGYAEIALDRTPEDSPLKPLLETMAKAGQKGAALTRQLLAFSRKQVLAPEIFDVNSRLRDMEAFFTRVLRENIRLAFDLAPGAGLVEADPGQFEQVIMNLVVNARDAMPDGGTLTLTTRLDDDRVAVAVGDTGPGIPPDVLARIFEPFFTTKGVGRGTGLGLSTALGIMEQSGGSLEVRSKVGAGATFTATLPRVRPGAAVAQAAPAALPERGTETILLAEDDEGVRGLTAHHLATAGYQVLAAADAAGALARLETHVGPVHLLLTDVVMPGLGGRDLARAVRGLRPGIRVLYMSGYPDDALVPEAGGEDLPLISKPFDRTRLLTMVRQVLDAGVSPAPLRG